MIDLLLLTQYICDILDPAQIESKKYWLLGQQTIASYIIFDV